MSANLHLVPAPTPAIQLISPGKGLFVCDNDSCDDMGVFKTIYVRAATNSVECSSCGEYMDEVDYRDTISEPFRSRGVSA